MGDPINLTGITPQSATAIQARMARNGIAPTQLGTWWDADTNRDRDPMDDPEVRQSLRSLAGDLWRAAQDARGGHA